MKPKTCFVLSGENAATVLGWLLEKTPFVSWGTSGAHPDHPFQVGLAKTFQPGGWTGSVVQVSTCPRTGFPSAELMVDASKLKKERTISLLEGLARLEVALITAKNNAVGV